MKDSKFSFAKISSKAPRSELHDLIKLTGCEVSVNNMAPNSEAPFSTTINSMRSAMWYLKVQVRFIPMEVLQKFHRARCSDSLLVLSEK